MTMQTTEYLYGIKIIELEGLLYFDALEYKKTNAKMLYEKLYDIKVKTEEEEIRMFYVYKAIAHTEKLLRERTEIV